MLASLAYSSCSFSETIFGQAPVSAYDWVMTQVLPQQAGLQVNAVGYRYTVDKIAEDPLLVHVQNENALGSGYIFRSTDDWSGLPGNTLNKTVPVGNIPIDYWGAGSIQTEGFGTVSDPRVTYSFSYDPCFDPQTSPDCPGWVDPTIQVEISDNYEDPLQDEYIRAEMERKIELEDKEEEERQRKKVANQKKRERLEVALGAVNAALMTAEAAAQADLLLAMNGHINQFYTNIPGGSYEESIEYQDKKLPDSKKGLRVGLAQQLLHEEMVQSQYDNLLSKSAK